MMYPYWMIHKGRPFVKALERKALWEDSICANTVTWCCGPRCWPPWLGCGFFGRGPEPLPEEGASPSPQASAAPSTPEEEGALVGVWVPYFSLNTAEHTQAAFEENFQTIAQTAQEKGANALFVHVRPFSDALYPSQYYPWSHILTGTQGQDPGFDPLEFMIETAHSLGMEFHAWLNPLRVKTAETPAALAENNPYVPAGGGVSPVLYGIRRRGVPEPGLPGRADPHRRWSRGDCGNYGRGRRPTLTTTSTPRNDPPLGQRRL